MAGIIQPDLQSAIGEDYRLLLEQVMSLTPEQIEKLSTDEQQQILQLRQTMVNLLAGQH